MRTKLFMLCCFLAIHLAQSQEVYLVAGTNFTSFDYKNSNDQSNANIKSGSGSNYELGYKLDFKKNFSYLIGVTINQFNAYGANGIDTYTWKTNYLGIQNALAYTILQSKKLALKINAGLNICTIANGEQLINASYYNLANESEFTGIFLQPMVGLQLQYPITERLGVSLALNTSRTFTKSKAENLSFTNNQIQFGLHFPF